MANAYGHDERARATALSRFDPLTRAYANGGNRRILLVPARSGGGRLTERTPAVQRRRRERLKVPQIGRSPALPQGSSPRMASRCGSRILLGEQKHPRRESGAPSADRG